MSYLVIKSSLDKALPPVGSDPDTAVPLNRWAIFQYAVRRHKLLELIAFVGTLLVLVLLRGGPHYESTAVVYVQPNQGKSITELTAASYDPTRYDSFMEQQLQTIVREDTLEMAIQQARQSGKDMWSFPGESLQSAAARLHGQVTVSRELGSYQVVISLIGTNPVAVAETLNDVVDAYIKTERNDELSQSNGQLSALVSEKQSVESELAKDRNELDQLSGDLGVADPTGHDSDPYDSQLKELQTQLLAARTAHAVAQARLQSIHGAGSSMLYAASDDTAQPDPAIAALKQTISQQRTALSIEMAGLKPSNPLYIQDRDQLAKLDQTLDSLSTDLHKKAGAELESKLMLDSVRSQDIQDRLEQQLKQLTATATSATPRLQRAASLSADVARLQGRLAEVENGISALVLEGRSLGMVHVVLPGNVPQAPMTSKRQLLFYGAIPIAVLCALLAAFLRQKLDPRVYIADQVTAVLQFPPMAVLPETSDVEPLVLDDLMLRLVAGIEQAHALSGARTFVFSAASSATSITTLVGSLALKMERLGYRMMVLKVGEVLDNFYSVDAVASPLWNGARTSLAKDSGLTRSGGEGREAEKLAGLTKNIDFLFIEGDPLLTSVETEFAARMADVTFLVAASGQTTRKDLRNAFKLTQRLNVRGVAAVLKNMKLKYADPEFRSLVRSIQARKSVVTQRDATGASGNRKYEPLNILATVGSNGSETAAHQEKQPMP